MIGNKGLHWFRLTSNIYSNKSPAFRGCFHFLIGVRKVAVGPMDLDTHFMTDCVQVHFIRKLFHLPSDTDLIFPSAS